MSTLPARMDRRTALKWMLTAAASFAVLDRATFAADNTPMATGYSQDPDLLKNYRPGDLWPLTFTEHQRRTAATLCDLIIPADDKSPGASELGVHDFIDEWISAPYPGHDADRRLVLEGFAWLDAEARRRFDNDFVNLVHRQQTPICDDICHTPRARAGFATAANFFARLRDLTVGGFYTTAEGMKDAGYTGNVPLASFDPAPSEVLQRLGLA